MGSLFRAILMMSPSRAGKAQLEGDVLVELHRTS